MPTGTGGRVRALQILRFWRYAHYRAREMHPTGARYAPYGCEICCAERNERWNATRSRYAPSRGREMAHYRAREMRPTVARYAPSRGREMHPAGARDATYGREICCTDGATRYMPFGHSICALRALDMFALLTQWANARSSDRKAFVLPLVNNSYPRPPRKRGEISSTKWISSAKRISSPKVISPPKVDFITAKGGAMAVAIKYQFGREMTNQGKGVVRLCWIWYDILTEK